LADLDNTQARLTRENSALGTLTTEIPILQAARERAASELKTLTRQIESLQQALAATPPPATGELDNAIESKPLGSEPQIGETPAAEAEGVITPKLEAGGQDAEEITEQGGR
jgi:chromosome segregation ATPase